MLRISQLKIQADHTEEQLRKKLIKSAQIKEKELKYYSIRKRSLDARKKPDLYYVYTIDFSTENEKLTIERSKGKVKKYIEKKYQPPEHGRTGLKNRPVIIGSGPAGLFCAYLLAQEGYFPLVIERGAPVRERVKDVESFWESGILNKESNVQFGEGGAGTFSDGKLNTLVKDKEGRNRFVLETFVKFGAPEDILYEQKPHIGTDILVSVIESMRKEIIEKGGEFLFHTQVTDVEPSQNMLFLNNGKSIKADAAVLAVGHSARDTFDMLYKRGIKMEAKSFAVGVRIEHLQSMIDKCMYGREDRGFLSPASYKLTEKLSDGRGVYTFCMCPGGYVVDASSESNMLAVNGMSYRNRAGINANSAVIVTVTKDDFGSDHPLAGVEFQRKLEKKAWESGSGAIPVQRFEDFRLNRSTEKFGAVIPCSKGRIHPCNVRSIFPEHLSADIEEGILMMGKKIIGFDDKDSILSGVESRTSSPVRILRNEYFVSENADWIYPCGEGAGYAGGITSAAMDGLKTAEAIIRKYRYAENDNVIMND